MNNVQFVRRDHDRSIYIVRVGERSGRVELKLNGSISVSKHSGLPKRDACRALEAFIDNQIKAVIADRRFFNCLAQGS